MSANVKDNQVKIALGVSGQPSPAVINEDFDLWILEEARDLWKFRNQAKVAGIDFHDRDSSNLRMVAAHLSPGAQAQSNPQHVLLIWTAPLHGVRPDDLVLLSFLRPL